MVKVRFYGDLQRFGREFKLDVMNAAEALRALTWQIPGLRKHISHDFYRVRVAKKEINEEILAVGFHSPLKEGDVIHIIPRALGAKNGFGIFSFIAGAVMLVVGLYTYNPYLITAGAGLMMGGVVSMLTKMPPTPNIDDSSKKSNTAFSNLDNTIGQGQPVPLCYGEMMVGSKVLSQGLSTE